MHNLLPVQVLGTGVLHQNLNGSVSGFFFEKKET